MPKFEKSSPFEIRISPHLQSAYNLARWLTKNDFDAEDVMQESMIKAFRFFNNLKNEDIKPWFLQIVRNTSFSWLKRNHNFVNYSDDLLEKVLEESREHTDTSETLLLHATSIGEIKTAMESLPPELREVLILREFEDLSYKEISTVICTKEGTVMSRLSRAREKLKEQLIQKRKGVNL